MRDHLLKHTQIKNYNCPECHVSFARKSRLKIHMMIHKGLKPFQCNICQKKFREKSNFNFHLKNHIKKSENSNFDINKRNSSYKNEIDSKENENIIKGNEVNENKTFLKEQDTVNKQNIYNLKNSGNVLINNNNQKEIINLQNNIDNAFKILEKDEVLINFRNIINQQDSDIIFIDEQKKSTDENSYLFNDNTIPQKYNFYEQNNIENTLNSFNNEDVCINNLNNVNKFGLIQENNNVELDFKNKIDENTYLLGFP